MRPTAWLAGLLLLVGAESSLALEPCFTQIKPRLFYSGFENGDLSGLVKSPPAGWIAGNDNSALESVDLGCGTTNLTWAMSGFAWGDYAFQTCVQRKGGACNDLGIVYRLQNPTHYYAFVLSDGTTAALKRWNGAGFDRIESVPFAYLADRWYVLRVQAVGAEHTAYINGQPVLSWTDATFLTGTAGSYARGTRGWFDNMISLLGVNPSPLAQNDQNPDGTDTGE